MKIVRRIKPDVEERRGSPLKTRFLGMTKENEYVMGRQTEKGKREGKREII